MPLPTSKPEMSGHWRVLTQDRTLLGLCLETDKQMSQGRGRRTGGRGRREDSHRRRENGETGGFQGSLD